MQGLRKKWNEFEGIQMNGFIRILFLCFIRRLRIDIQYSDNKKYYLLISEVSGQRRLLNSMRSAFTLPIRIEAWIRSGI